MHNEVTGTQIEKKIKNFTKGDCFWHEMMLEVCYYHYNSLVPNIKNSCKSRRWVWFNLLIKIVLWLLVIGLIIIPIALKDSHTSSVGFISKFLREIRSF
jgi:hypothetical protein